MKRLAKAMCRCLGTAEESKAAERMISSHVGWGRCFQNTCIAKILSITELQSFSSTSVLLILTLHSFVIVLCVGIFLGRILFLSTRRLSDDGTGAFSSCIEEAMTLWNSGREPVVGCPVVFHFSRAKYLYGDFNGC